MSILPSNYFISSKLAVKNLSLDSSPVQKRQLLGQSFDLGLPLILGL